MKKYVKCFLLILCVSLIEMNYLYSQTDENLALLFKKPEKTNFLISPNGLYICYIAPFEDKDNIYVYDIASGNEVAITRYTDSEVESCFWGDQQRLVFLLKKAESTSLYAVDYNGKKLKKIIEEEGVKVGFINPLRTLMGEVLIGCNKRDKVVMDAYKVDIYTGGMTLVAQNPGRYTQWIPDHLGKLRLVVESDGVNSTILIREQENTSFQKLLTIDYKQVVEPLFFTFDNKNIYALSNQGRDKLALVILDANSGKEIEQVYENPDYDLSKVYFSLKDKKITSLEYVSCKKEKMFLSDKAKKLFELVSKEIISDEFAVIDYSESEDLFLVRCLLNHSYGSVYLYDMNKDYLKKLWDLSPWLDSLPASIMRSVSYKSMDGQKIQGYLSIAKGVDTIGMPLVVYPHTQLDERYKWGFDPVVHYLTLNGFAVFQPNYRGTFGFGKQFWQSGFKQQGGLVLQDIADGVKWLVDNGYADQKRISIIGESYGGNIAINSLARYPDLYRCGASLSGMLDMEDYLNAIPVYWKAYRNMMYEILGNPLTDKELIKKSSPIEYVQHIKSPVLIGQGGKDMMVKKIIADKFIEKLETNMIDVTYILKFDEGHGFEENENILEYNRTLLNFLRNNMK